MQECYWCTALIPVRAARCPYCRSDLAGSMHSSHLPSQRVIRDLQEMRRTWRRIRWAAAFLFGSGAVIAGAMFGQHLAEVASKTGQLNLVFAVVTGAAFIVCSLLVIMVKPDREE